MSALSYDIQYEFSVGSAPGMLRENNFVNQGPTVYNYYFQSPRAELLNSGVALTDFWDFLLGADQGN